MKYIVIYILIIIKSVIIGFINGEIVYISWQRYLYGDFHNSSIASIKRNKFCNNQVFFDDKEWIDINKVQFWKFTIVFFQQSRKRFATMLVTIKWLNYCCRLQHHWVINISLHYFQHVKKTILNFAIKTVNSYFWGTNKEKINKRKIFYGLLLCWRMLYWEADNKIILYGIYTFS